MYTSTRNTFQKHELGAMIKELTCKKDKEKWLKQKRNTKLNGWIDAARIPPELSNTTNKLTDSKTRVFGGGTNECFPCHSTWSLTTQSSSSRTSGAAAVYAAGRLSR